MRTWVTSTPAASSQEHRKAFQQMWLRFLKHQVGRGGGTQGRAPVRGSPDGEAGTLTCCFPQLPLRVCKKVLVIMHDSILPHLAQPSLMIDFLTRAYDIGEQETERDRAWGGALRSWMLASSRVESRGPAGQQYLCWRFFPTSHLADGLWVCWNLIPGVGVLLGWGLTAVSVCRWSRQSAGLEWPFHLDS